MKEAILADLIGEEAREAFADPKRWTIVPLGSLEYHGPRGPLGTDSDVAGEVSNRVAAALGAVLLPVLPFGDSSFHARYAGTVVLEPATLCAVLTDIAASLRRHGARRLLFLLGHWGNFAAAKKVKKELTGPDLQVEVLRIFDPELLDMRGMAELFGGKHYADHGGAMEVSVSLYARPEVSPPSPESVRASSLPPEKRDYEILGWTGLPEEASAERGRQVVDLISASIVRYISSLKNQIAD